MKKLFLALAVVLGMATMGFAQNGGGLFEEGEMPTRGGTGTEGTSLILPTEHGSNQDFNGESGPLGGGIVLLAGLGAAYLIGKKRKD